MRIRATGFLFIPCTLILAVLIVILRLAYSHFKLQLTLLLFLHTLYSNLHANSTIEILQRRSRGIQQTKLLSL